MTETPKQERTQAAGAASDCNDLLGVIANLLDANGSRIYADAVRRADNELKRQAVALERADALTDLAFARGVAAGWNCETAEQRERLTASLRAPALAELKRLREVTPNAHVQVRLRR